MASLAMKLILWFLAKLAFTYAEITDKPYSVACGFMNNHISIVILWATHHCFQGWIPSGCMAEYSPSSMAEWCRFEPVPSITSFFPFVFPFYLLLSCICWLFPSFPLVQNPCPVSYWLLFSCFNVFTCCPRPLAGPFISLFST